MRYLYLSSSIYQVRKGPDCPYLGHGFNPCFYLRVQGNGLLWSVRPWTWDRYVRKGLGESHSGQFIAIAPTVHYTIYEDPGRITLFHFLWHKTTIYHAHRLYGSGMWMWHSRDVLSLFHSILGLWWKTWNQGLDTSEGSFIYVSGSWGWYSAWASVPFHVASPCGLSAWEGLGFLTARWLGSKAEHSVSKSHVGTILPFLT